MSSNDASLSEKRRSVSVIIPTYNERRTIEEVVTRCLSTAGDADVEVIVVDDRSPDETAELVRKTFGETSRVRLVVPERRVGLAQSIRHGFEVASGDVLIKLDADLQHPPDAFVELVGRIDETTGVAVGSRYLPDGGTEVGRYRYFLSRGATLLAKLLVPSLRPFTDPLSGYYALRDDVYESTKLSSSSLKPLLDVLAQTPVESVGEVPYTFSRRAAGNSKLGLNAYETFLLQLLELREKTGATLR